MGLKIAYWLKPPTKGQPPKRGQSSAPKVTFIRRFHCIL